jgi:hypothetical protein
MTLAVLAAQLVVFVQQRKLMAEQLKVSTEADERARKHDRLSVRPFLDFKADSTQPNLLVLVENHGAGSALNVRIEVKVDGKIVPTNTGEPWPKRLLTALGVTDIDLAHTIQLGFLPMPTTHLRPGGDIKLVDLHFSDAKDVQALCRRLSFEAHYESVYLNEDEPFVSRLNWSSNYVTK